MCGDPKITKTVVNRDSTVLRMPVYMVETMDMERSHWNNGVSGTEIISKGVMVLIVQDKTL